MELLHGIHYQPSSGVKSRYENDGDPIPIVYVSGYRIENLTRPGPGGPATHDAARSAVGGLEVVAATDERVPSM